MPVSAPAYRPDIDGLRAVAIMLVVLFHAFPEQVPGGFIGVDVFFVISGFLISRIILREHKAGDFSFLNFYARRFRRILPALLMVLTAVWGFGWFALLGGEFKSLGRHIQAGALFLSNFQLFQETGYFNLASESKPLLHLWSLSVEEQYYLAYPLLLVLLLRAPNRLAWWVGGIGAVSFAFNVASIHAGDGIFAFYFLPSRFWELLLGGLLAVMPPAGQRSRPWETNALAIVALALMILAAFRLQPSDLYPGWLALVPTLATVLCIYSGASSRVNRYLLGHPAMVTLGKMSYALYLWHWPLLCFARIVQEGEPSVGQRTFLIAVSVVLAYLTWRWVERPAQACSLPASDLTRARKVLAWGIAGLGAVFLIGAVTFMHQGFPARYAPLEPVPPSFITQSRSCVEKYSTEGAFCIETGDAPKIAVIGDSHAEAFLRGLPATGSNVSRSLILLGGNSCPYLTDVNAEAYPGCLNTNRRIDKIIEGLPSLETVVLFVRGPRYLIPDRSFDVPYQSPVEWRLRGLTADTSRLAAAELLKAGLSRTIAKLELKGKKVVIFVVWPEMNFDPVTCFDVRPLRLWPVAVKTPCAMPLAGVQERQAGYRAMLRELKARHPGITLFDPLPYLCDVGNCWAVRDGRPLYSDSSHVNARGVGILEPAFVQLLSKLIESP